MSMNPLPGRALVPLRADVAEALVRNLRLGEGADLAEAFEHALRIAQNPQVLDLWDQQGVAITYWVLMLTGVNQSAEIAIAQDLLVWQAFFSKDTARVLCVQSSERSAFRCCSGQFSVHNCPTLIFSDTPEMDSFIKVDAGLLAILAEEEGGLQRFLTKIHTLVESGKSLQQVRDVMLTEAFFRGLKVMLKEAKNLISITIGPSK